jgi:pimeloyl-ACP methyl ester carboxylesterase
MAIGSTAAKSDLAGDADLICRENGNTLLTRTIRYIEDRRRAEHRYTGAIETHPSPLGVIWGSDDPIAVREMATRVVQKRPDATLCVLEGVGHYPMLEAPDDFLAAASRMLVATRP